MTKYEQKWPRWTVACPEYVVPATYATQEEAQVVANAIELEGKCSYMHYAVQVHSAVALREMRQRRRDDAELLANVDHTCDGYRYSAVLGRNDNTVQRVLAALYNGTDILMTMPHPDRADRVVVILQTDPHHDATYQAERLRSFGDLGVWGPYSTEVMAREAVL